MVAELSVGRGPLRALVRGTTWVVGVGASAAATSALVGAGVSSVAGDRKAHWLLGRAAGISSYLLMVGLVSFGLLLSHPATTAWKRPTRPTRMRIHVSLAVFTLAFTVLHIVVLATDPWAGVGWRGTVIPGAASYRPLAVSLGVIGLYAGLLAGLTAAAAGRIAGRIWWPIHKVAIVTLVLIWVHAVQAGSDTSALFAMYLATGAFVVVLAASRYTARSPQDSLAARIRADERKGVRR
jgi:hypothetical protein